MAPSTYAGQTFVQRLLWKERCDRAGPEEFEQLFHSIMERIESGFVATRPHGRLGDRKTDGFDTSTGTAYGVYSPNSVGLAKTLRKIRTDLDGAVAYWNDTLNGWTFVYNARGRPKPGVPTDIAAALIAERERYTGLEIAHLSDEDLWRRVRDELSPADRADILGDQYPEDWAGYIPPPGASDQELEDLARTRIVIIHDTLQPIDTTAVLQALAPIRPLGTPVRLRPSVAELDWEGAAEQQAREIEDVLENAGGVGRFAFAVFAISEIPLLVHLGYRFSDILDLELFQYHRDDRTWRWPEGREATEVAFSVSGLPEEPLDEETEVVVRVSLSARVRPDQTRAVVAGGPVEVDVAIERPTREWLTHPDPLRQLRRRFRRLLEEIAEKVPGCQRVHLFYAGPAPGAVAIGQAINPRMTPPVELYEFRRSATPAYEAVLRLDHVEK